MIEAAVYSVLTSSGSIAAIVGTRVYLQQRLIGTTLPAVTFEIQSNAAVRMLSGASGLFSAEVVVTSVAETYAAARSLAETVRAAFEGSYTAPSAVLESIRFDTESPLESVFGDGDENEPTRIEQIYQVHYRSAP
jgi:hypothetical protein